MSTTREKNAVGYVRVSTQGQAENGVSLSSQRARIKTWATANGYALAGVFVENGGASGSRADNRVELQRALAAACRKGRALVVYSLSRLARSTRDTIEIADRLARAGADLVSLSEQIDTTSAAGKMVFKMLAVLAEFERDLVAERTSAALQHKRAIGERVGGIPFGFDLEPGGVRLRENPDEQAAVRRIVTLRREGHTYRSIAAALERAGVSPKRGGRWHGKVVRDIARRAVE
ncbi:MAG: recombinase family protein [Phycisphaerae bacterium]